MTQPSAREATTGRDSPAPGVWLRALRPAQWSKNLLVAVPAFAAHRFREPAVLLDLLVAVACFCAVASAIYLCNDVLDAEADRAHPRKRLRPIAAGAIAPAAALGVAALLAGLAVAAAVALLPPQFTVALLGYAAVATGYTLLLKRIAVVDVMALALLYTLRLVAGGAANEVPLSFWLLLFSCFLFLSLALLKRYAELVLTRSLGREQLAGRDYQVSDLPLLAAGGLSAGNLSVLVLALYVNADAVSALYRRPALVALICPLLLLWLMRVWLLAHRGRVPDDPVAFALRDPASWLIAGAMLLALVAAI